MKSKRGFTLIELLAIIVILAIIAVITVPIILNIVEDATKNAAIDSAYGYKDAINKFYASKLLQDKDYYIPSGSYYVDGDNGYLEGTETLDIAVSGKIPSFGKVIIGNGSKVGEMQLCINDYMVSYIDEKMDVVKGCTPVEPGLYDQSNNLVVSYDYLVSEYGFDPSIDRNYSSRDTNNNILANYSNGTKLVLPDTVTKIGDYVFYENASLTSVTIPSSVTSIGESAFENTNLTSITIPSNVISIGSYAFNNCSNLSNVTFESGSQLTSIGYKAFSDTNLKSVTIPSSVTSIGARAFYNCTSLTSVTFENGSQLTSIGDYAFSSTGLTSITIPSSVTSIGSGAFENIKIVYYTGGATGSPWGAKSVNPYIDDDFIYSDNTKTELKGYLGSSSSVVIPSSVTSIGKYAFKNDKNLMSVIIPSSVTSIGDYAFYGCGRLTNVTFESGSQLTSIGNSAFYSSRLTSITLPSSVTSIGSWAFDGTHMKSITIPSGVTSIGENAFKYMRVVYYTGSATGAPWGANGVNLYTDGDFVYSDSTKTVLKGYIGTSSSVTVPSSVTSIGARAFYSDLNLTSVTIPSSVTSIGNEVFRFSSNLASVTFESGSQLTSIGEYAFYQNESLTSITIPSGVTSIGSGAFYNALSLVSITIPSSVTSIGNDAFNSIGVVYYTGSATGSPWGAIIVNPYVDGDFAYSDSTKKTLKVYLGTSSSVTIPSGVTSIGKSAFKYSRKFLTSVTIPSSVTSIGDYVFNNCSNLTNVTFENGSQLTSIGDYAFYASPIASITIPSSVTSIGYDAFNGSKIVYYTGSASGSPWGAGSVVSQ